MYLEVRADVILTKLKLCHSSLVVRVGQIWKYLDHYRKFYCRYQKSNSLLIFLVTFPWDGGERSQSLRPLYTYTRDSECSIPVLTTTFSYSRGAYLSDIIDVGRNNLFTKWIVNFTIIVKALISLEIRIGNRNLDLNRFKWPFSWFEIT